jgi:hypothetical protein
MLDGGAKASRTAAGLRAVSPEPARSKRQATSTHPPHFTGSSAFHQQRGAVRSTSHGEVRGLMVTADQQPGNPPGGVRWRLVSRCRTSPHSSCR